MGDRSRSLVADGWIHRARDFSTNSDNGNSAYGINEQDEVTGNLIVKTAWPYLSRLSLVAGHGSPSRSRVVDGAVSSLGNGINNLGRIAGGSLASGDVWEPMTWGRKSV
jgi:hypothetical protein